ncbi:RodZ family helix-turn-helix domain-containing protein [Paraburkholderia sediminicola]|uniref:hypothetical protein n=1 Tax=Paraburkholderia sediminicola TaxID=458836 RepID=UPI0038BE015B
MSILKEKFQQIKAAIAQAINFADPAEVLQKAEHAFLEATAEAYHALEDRVGELEQKLQSLIDPTAKVSDEPPLEAGTATSGESTGAIAATTGVIAADAALDTGATAAVSAEAGNGDSAAQPATDGSATATSSDAASSTPTTPASLSAATPGADAANTATA